MTSPGVSADPFDVRHIDRFLAEGKVSPEQYQAHLDSLEDSSENLDKSNVRFLSYNRHGPVGYGENARQDDEEG